MKKSKYIFIGACIILSVVLAVLLINNLNYLCSAELSAGDALNYVGTMVGAISTFVLSLVACMQNEKLHELEDNNYIASNSCMVLIEEVIITPKAGVPSNYESDTDQILNERDNVDDVPSGYKMRVKLRKTDTSVQATPSLIHVSKCELFVGDNEKNTLESKIRSKNVREGYTRVAILESGIAFECKLLLSKDKQKKFETDIKAEKNRLTVEFEFMIITDKYVMTKCKCRAYCDYQNNSGAVTWHCEKPMVFFYGHELKNRKDILVLGE